MIGLCCSGGGAKGAWQAGVLKAFDETTGRRKVKAVSGASVGALNAAMYVQGDMERLEGIWRSIKRSDVYGWFPWILGKTGVYSTRPLRKLIDENVRLDAIKKSGMLLYVGATEIVPNVFVDGGVYDNSPINPLIDAGCTDIVWLSLNTKPGLTPRGVYFRPSAMRPHEFAEALTASASVPVIFEPVVKDTGVPPDWRDGISLMIQAFMAKSEQMTLERVERINDEVRAGTAGPGKRIVRIHRIVPPFLKLSMLDFDPAKCSAAFDDGYRYGIRRLAQIPI